LSAHDARFFATANCFYRRRALEQTDGFDERFRRAAGEDTDLGLRALALGGRAAYAADALVHHDVRPSEWRAAANEAWRKWIDLALVVRKHPEIRGTLLYRRVFWKRSHAVLLPRSRERSAPPSGRGSACSPFRTSTTDFALHRSRGVGGASPRCRARCCSTCSRQGR
jgi:GT2 family glycosyltransferase